MVVSINSGLTFVKHSLTPKGKFSWRCFGRHGGCSPHPFDSLNGSIKRGDSSDNVLHNLQIMADSVGIDPKQMCFVSQQHTSEVLVVSDNDQVTQNIVADAMVTKLRGKALCVTTADCVPIIFVDQVSGVIGITHAGWRGQIGGIVENTISALLSLGSSEKNIMMIIGPCIRKDSYVVGSELFEQFVAKYPESENFFSALESPLSDGIKKYKMDLAANACSLAMSAGVYNIYDCCIDTFANEDFFSCRRAKGSEQFGVNVSLVFLDLND